MVQRGCPPLSLARGSVSDCSSSHIRYSSVCAPPLSPSLFLYLSLLTMYSHPLYIDMCLLSYAPYALTRPQDSSHERPSRAMARRRPHPGAAVLGCRSRGLRDSIPEDARTADVDLGAPRTRDQLDGPRGYEDIGFEDRGDRGPAPQVARSLVVSLIPLPRLVGFPGLSPSPTAGSVASLAAGGSAAGSHARAPSRSEDEGRGGCAACVLVRVRVLASVLEDCPGRNSRHEGTAYGVRSVRRRDRDVDGDETAVVDEWAMAMVMAGAYGRGTTSPVGTRPPGIRCSVFGIQCKVQTSTSAPSVRNRDAMSQRHKAQRRHNRRCRCRCRRRPQCSGT